MASAHDSGFAASLSGSTPVLQQSVTGDHSGGLHFPSLLGAKPTSVETPKTTFLTLSVTLPLSIAALRKVHSITSSAVESNVGGMARPSDLAVFMLMTSSNLVGVCTGKSPGFSPLRMRST
jgi:hypothetical protein